MSSQIFISYGEHDKLIAKRLFEDLKNRGMNPWMAGENLLGGQNRNTEIEKAIRGSRYFLALLSKHSNSEHGRVQRELNIANDFKYDFSENDIFIIPVRLEACQPDILDMQKLEPVDLFKSYEEGFKRLLRAIQADDDVEKNDEIPIIVNDDSEDRSELTGLNESDFIANLFEQFYTNNPIVLLGQEGREQQASRELLIDYFSEKYGAENVIRLVPVRGKNVTVEQYFAYLGRQFQPRENLSGSFDFITCIEDRLEQVDRLFLMVHGFEGGSEEGTEELASAFLTLLEHNRSKLHLLISGGERLAEMTMHGMLSYLKSAKIEEWPELTPKDVMMLCPDNSIDDETAKQILKLTGGHPRLITRCIVFCKKQGRFDESACRENLLQSRYIQSLFLRLLKSPNRHEQLKKMLGKEIIGPYAPYIKEDLKRRLFWLNLLKKSEDEKQLLWRCEVIQKIGVSTL